MDIKRIILFISLIISIFSLITEIKNDNLNSMYNEEDYFINDMSEEDFVKTYTEPYSNFFNLEENKNSYCDLCKSGSDILLNTILQKYKWGYLHSFTTFMCSFFLRKDICYSAIGKYGPVVLESTFKRLFNKEKICTSLFICKPSIEYESVDEYARRILKNKNEKEKNINPSNNKTEFSFIQVTDIHLQLDYKENKVINCNIPLCCRDSPEELGYKNNKNHK